MAKVNIQKRGKVYQYQFEEAINHEKAILYLNDLMKEKNPITEWNIKSIHQLVLNYENWNDFHPIIQAALLHGELVKAHPFVDGNGRTSRLLMNLVLMNYGFYSVIIKKENRLKYYEALDKAHTTTDYTDFVKLITKLEIEILKKYLELL